MEVIADERQSGKTTALIEWQRDDPGRRVILVHSHAMVNNLRRRFGLPVESVRTYRWWRDHHRSLGVDVEVGVDEAQLALQEIFGNVQYITLTSLD